MDQIATLPTTASATSAAAAPPVDPLLVEALQNPRHRLTVLRMELDIQNFMQNSEQHQLELPHFPTSYLRLVAHRVAQHYTLQTMVQDNFADCQGTTILVRKLADSKYPVVCLSDVPTKASENNNNEKMRIVIKPRPGKGSSNGMRKVDSSCSIRSVEERMEEYDRARARIFSCASSPEPEDSTTGNPLAGKSFCFSGDENDGSRNYTVDLERNLSRDSSTSRVAIFRDREKDLTDPDYDRSYVRYVKNLPTGQIFSSVLDLPRFQPYIQYDSGSHQLGRMPGTQASFVCTSPSMNPSIAIGLNPAPRDAVYMQWPSHAVAMMYMQSYDPFRHPGFQAVSLCQQPLSFDYMHHH